MSASSHVHPQTDESGAHTVPRYPEVRVCMHSENPLALVSAVRYALRRAGVDAGQISRFSGEALEPHSDETARRVCQAWVNLKAPVN
jgi:hypothetical protein